MVLRLANGIIPELGVEAQRPFDQSDRSASASAQIGTEPHAAGLGDVVFGVGLRFLF